MVNNQAEQGDQIGEVSENGKKPSIINERTMVKIFNDVVDSFRAGDLFSSRLQVDVLKLIAFPADEHT